MINLDQVRTLEWKVKQAVQLIVHLRRENDTLRGRLSDTEVRLQELETLLDAFKATQSEMESGIRSALEELDNLETGVADPVAGPVDPVTYPPVAEEFATEEPAALFERDAPHVAAVVDTFATDEPSAVFERNSEPDAERSFEEEFAALAAEEAATVSSSIPESVELEAEAPESEAPPFVEEKRPEQPGLGIF